MGAWWDENRDFIQPTEFLLTQSGKVMASTYSNSPGRILRSAKLLECCRRMDTQTSRPVAQKPRVDYQQALAIGNADYDYADVLRNPVNDAD
jgi:hypothetical protein